MAAKYNNSVIVSRLSGFFLSLSVEVGVKDYPKEIKRLCVSQKHTGRCTPKETNGLEWGAKNTQVR